MLGIILKVEARLVLTTIKTGQQIPSRSRLFHARHYEAVLKAKANGESKAWAAYKDSLAVIRCACTGHIVIPLLYVHLLALAVRTPM
jgi:hypothetical protein